MTEKLALKAFEIENDMRTYEFHDPSSDEDFEALYHRKPWREDPHYFKRVVMSAQCLMKILSHAKRGGSIEIMGLLQGKIRGDAFYLTDCFPLPVEGTETRVNAGESANEFMVQFVELNERTRFSNEMVCGWYHSHPGYGCWLSGIDVATQSLYQSHQEPFVALVVDPIRTSLTGKVDLGAFRTFPDGYNPPDDHSVGNSRGLPLGKVEDYGMHCNRYYSLETEVYKSPYDEAVINMLWKEHWANLLSEMSKRKHVESLDVLETAIERAKNEKDPDLHKVVDSVKKCACERLSCLARRNILYYLFNKTSLEMDTTDSSS